MAKGNNTIMWVAIAAVIAYFTIFNNSANAASGGAGTMVSDSQLAQTASLEKFSPVSYPDGTDANGNQVYSIGYGHQIQPGESYPNGITQDQGQQLMLQDSAAVVNVLANSGLTFTQGQFDGFWDFGYSAGVGALNKVLQNFQANGLDAAAAEMKQYIYWHPVPGGPPVQRADLVSRRNLEVNTLNS